MTGQNSETDNASPSDTATAMQRLLDVMARLRSPDGGCPWDRQQNFSTIAPYTIEEAYEVAEAIRENDMSALSDELGDLLFQVVFHAQIASETGVFDFDTVADGIAEKMIRRHPHVFGTAEEPDPVRHKLDWETQKAAERVQKAISEDRRPSALDNVALSLPALMRAEKLQRRAARVGFDWPDVGPVVDKVYEELEELALETSATSPSPAAISEEIGDLLFACVNLARHHGVDAETALRDANSKFTRRFQFIENELASQERSPQESNLQEMDTLWNKAKASEPKSR